MNLLVTNTRAAQAYFVIRALRPYAKKIVATIYGRNFPVAWLSSHAAHSRLVDKYYHVPSFAGDWKRGKIARENSPKEEAYIEEILRICEVNQIDTIFPSWDAQVCVFSKNKERFEKLEVLIPIPDYEVWRILLDKYQVILLAREAGFPCPKTYLPQNLEDVRGIVETVEFPVTIKPRFASWGIEIATDRSVLLEKTRHCMENYGMPMVQEFIPGGLRQDLHFLIDKRGELKLAFHRGVRRTLRLDSYAHISTVNELTNPQPFQVEASAFLRALQKLGWWGSGIIETVVDPRDGKAKFMELIPRFRRQLWNTTELGINEPWMCIRIARDEPVEPVKNYPVGTLFLSPVEDVLVFVFQILDLLVYRLKRILGQNALDPWSLPLTLKELFQSFTRSYFCRKPKIVDPYFRYFFHDPLVSLLWWLQLFSWVSRLTRQLGR